MADITTKPAASLPEVTDITGGTLIGEQDGKAVRMAAELFRGADGADGKNGKDGEDGKDGADGKDGSDGNDGQDGADGVSPTVSVAEINGGHRVTVTDAEGRHSFDVMDGEDGSVSFDDLTDEQKESLKGEKGDKGDTGAQGPQGAAGADGVSPAVSVGVTATFPSGRAATVAADAASTDEHLILNFGIPKGAAGPQGPQGETGATGPQGPAGADGVGVPSGGTAGQVLAKASGADYDTEWVDQAAAGGGESGAYIFNLDDLTWAKNTYYIRSGYSSDVWTSSSLELAEAAEIEKLLCVAFNDPSADASDSSSRCLFLTAGMLETASYAKLEYIRQADSVEAVPYHEASLSCVITPGTDSAFSAVFTYSVMTVTANAFLPAVTGSDKGKALAVVGGKWTAKALTWTGTQAEYNALGAYDDGVTYNIVEG